VTEDISHRQIRSFVRRQGRLTTGQSRALGELWPRYGIEYSDTELDLDAAYGRRAPRCLEIGFGNGELLLWLAQNNPAIDYLGVEVHRPGVGRLMNALAAHNVDNVRLYNHDAIEVLQQCIAPESLAEVRIYFPDPWPKKRQQKRRLIRAEFVALLASRVKCGGRLHLATDWADYAAQMLTVLEASTSWRSTAAAERFVQRPPWRIETHFEQRGRRLGHGVWDLVYDRC